MWAGVVVRAWAPGASATSAGMSMAANSRSAAVRPSANTGCRLASWRRDWAAIISEAKNDEKEPMVMWPRWACQPA